MRSLILSLILMFLFCSPAFADYWNWTPEAKHHAAIVHVQCGQHGGSGVLCKKDGTIATAYHVIETGGQLTVTWQSGYRSHATINKIGKQNDVAFLNTTPPENAVFIPLVPLDQRPAIGDDLEYLGYGGPTNKLRHFSGKVTEVEPGMIVGDAYLLNGDSGGGVIWKGFLVATISGGRDKQSAAAFEDGNRDRWPLHYPALTGRVAAKASNAGCVPGGCYPQQQRGIIFRSPFQRYQSPSQPQQREISAPPPQQQSVPPRQTTPEPDIQDAFANINASIGRIEATIAELQKSQATPNPVEQPKLIPVPGPAGPPGSPGKNAAVDYDVLAAKVAERIGGCECEQKKPAELARHIVVVANQSSESWPRLKEDIDRASDSYSGIRLAPPPKFAVPLPQIVAYENGIPVKVIAGIREVSEALSRVARGELVFFKE